ncbi:hypothetical protein [Haloterrigena salinisoli]|uniref:hypothetical protein n=1 Tax=Haloterrigena salinisoli TaxID=3132747 RepID=UPI0030D0AD68
MYEGILKRGSLRRRLGIIVLYLVLIGGLVWLGAAVPWAGTAFVLLLLGGFTVAKYRARKYNFTDDQEIPIDAIDSVIAREGNTILTRPRFVVRYNADDERKRRYVMLPSRLYAGTESAYETGKQLFRRHGIDVTEADGWL